MSMLIEVWGDYACFTRPEMKTERVSYDMITPSAARGLVEAIYWHPGLRYTVDRIYLLKPFGLDPEDEASTEEYTQRPIRFTNIRRNEVNHPAVLRRPQCGQRRHTAGALHLGGHPAAGRDGPAGRSLRHRVPL